jgi:CHRD domain
MRKRIAVLLGSAVVLVGAVAAVALARPSASSTSYKANLDTRQEVPKETGASIRASGSFSATLTGTKLSWKLTFDHLTGAATAAHVHSGAKGKAGPVIVPLCSPCKSPASGTARVTAAVAKMLQSGNTYVNVHTGKNPNGEIRGQVKGSM